MIAYWLLFGTGGLKDYTGEDMRQREAEIKQQDMTDSIFTDANVSGLDLHGTPFHDAVMLRVLAENTDFSQAVLKRVDMQGANLRGANLAEADLEYADLRGADLRGADLRGVNFRHTNLEGADLRNTLGGPHCPTRRFTTPDWCGLSPEEANSGCCPPAFDATDVEGMKACLQPWWDIVREGQTQDFGVQGEPDYTDVTDIDLSEIRSGRYVCTEQPPPSSF